MSEESGIEGGFKRVHESIKTLIDKMDSFRDDLGDVRERVVRTETLLETLRPKPASGKVKAPGTWAGVVGSRFWQVAALAGIAFFFAAFLLGWGYGGRAALDALFGAISP